MVQSMARGNALMINEVNTHQDGQFIELINLEGNEKTLDSIGLLVVDRVNYRTLKLRPRMLINLSGSVIKRFGLIHFGQLSLESLVTPTLEHRIFYAMGYLDSNWLQIENTNFISIFLFKDVANAPLANKPKFIDGSLLTFLKQNLLDYVVIR